MLFVFARVATVPVEPCNLAQANHFSNYHHARFATPSRTRLRQATIVFHGHELGGHVAPGCIARTTAEVLLALLPDWQFTREPDAHTGFDELVIRVQS